MIHRSCAALSAALIVQMLESCSNCVEELPTKCNRSVEQGWVQHPCSGEGSAADAMQKNNGRSQPLAPSVVAGCWFVLLNH